MKRSAKWENKQKHLPPTHTPTISLSLSHTHKLIHTYTHTHTLTRSDTLAHTHTQTQDTCTHTQRLSHTKQTGDAPSQIVRLKELLQLP